MISGLSINPSELLTVKDILHQFIPDCEVWAFGSRTSDRVKPYSDLDLAIIGDTFLPLLTHAQLEEAFSSSLLPWKVDILDWANADDRFRDLIRKNHILIQKKDCPF
ncbi:putative nucleotidyltransferase [Zymomonas mobilis]|uniref:nucleotidyltransferase family protein n=1 Tax=Zymomonas mobilis TaxID=542 RepID=UPI00026D81F0|nr:nucleotidyltransferase domain-containing protein [Zymomonas mobilis]AFN57573.1 DNA polymerase beta domain protein region [Zymomonas mobilis subsp. mobilis ATCC 29191]TQK74410.1 putative nucleotidyltransferase [Zymomonas mobilis]TQL14654.1 putative nucleotidyltransferase [Zymomonas mobilis]GEB88310.1 hypothetical protein ZMO01_16500 [Zymomonas mobilis subsp. mobilis]